MKQKGAPRGMTANPQRPAGRAVSPDPLAQLQARGVDLLRQGKPREAGLIFQQVLAATPNHPDGLNGLGLAFHGLGMQEEARQILSRAIAAAPSRATFHANLGLVLMALGRPDKAAESYRKAVRHEPAAAQFELHYGMALLAGGRAQEAAQAERRAIAKRPDLAEAHAFLGRALLAGMNHERARALASRIWYFRPPELGIDGREVDHREWKLLGRIRPVHGKIVRVDARRERSRLVGGCATREPQRREASSAE